MLYVGIAFSEFNYVYEVIYNRTMRKDLYFFFYSAVDIILTSYLS